MHRNQSCREMRDKVICHRGRHKGTVILLHGMYGSVKDFDDISLHLSHIGCRCILMSAPRRTIHWPSGTEYDVTSWYDYYTKKGWRRRTRHDQFTSSRGANRKIGYDCQDRNASHRSSQDLRRWLLTGRNSSDACMRHRSIETYRWCSIASCLLHAFVGSYPLVKGLNLLVFAGSSDDVYTLSLQRTAFGVFEQHGANVQWVVKNGLKHHSPSSSEMTSSIQFICSLTK